MARLDPSWSDGHIVAIARRESELGRSICGYPMAEGGPCAAKPVAEGRCGAHGAPAASSAAGSGSGNRVLLWVGIGIILALLSVGIAYKLLHDPAEEIWREAASLMAMGETARGRTLLELLARDYAMSPAGVRAISVLGPQAAGVHRGTPTERLYYEARNFYPLGARSANDLEEAVARYLSLADSYPTEPLTREALYEAAHALDHLGRPLETVRTWERFIAAYPDDGRVPEALYAIGYLYHFQLGEPAVAKARLAELISRYPESNAAVAAKLLLEQGSAAATAPPPSGPPSIYTTPGRL